MHTTEQAAREAVAAVPPPGTRLRFAPVVELRTGQVVGLHVRMPGDQRSPRAWGQRLAEALAVVAATRTLTGASALGLVVDVSLPALSPSLAATVLSHAEQHRVPADLLSLRVHALDAADTGELARDTLRALRAAGVHVAVDVEDVSYASWLRTSRVPATTLTVRAGDRTSRQRLSRLVAVADDLGAHVIATGLDDATAAAEALAAGAEFGEGPLWGMDREAWQLPADVLAPRPGVGPSLDQGPAAPAEAAVVPAQRQPAIRGPECSDAVHQALSTGAVIVVGSPDRLRWVARALTSSGVPLSSLVAAGRYRGVDSSAPERLRDALEGLAGTGQRVTVVDA